MASRCAIAASLITCSRSQASSPHLLREDRSIVVASTTSTQDSGLFEYLCRSSRQSGITVKVISQGTGQALDTGRRGDADVCSSMPSAGGKISRRRRA